MDGHRREMTDLGRLLAYNMKKQREKLKISQAVLAERARTSTHYIGMIEGCKKRPALDMIQRIAKGLKMDSPELFSMQGFPSARLKEYRKEVLEDIEEAAEEVLEEKLVALEGRIKQKA
jgi:transcriptional regulator with XRE-family HTH domain